jgi:hypothetical protein
MLKKMILSQDLNGIRAIILPLIPQSKMSWDQYHDYAQVTQLGRDLVKAYPNLVKMESVGKSHEGRDLLTISDFDSDKVENKPGFI